MLKGYVTYNLYLDVTKPEPVLILIKPGKTLEELKSFTILKSKCSDLTFKIDTDLVDVFTEVYDNPIDYQIRLVEINACGDSEHVNICSGNICFKLTIDSFNKLKPYLRDLCLKNGVGDLKLVNSFVISTDQEPEESLEWRSGALFNILNIGISGIGDCDDEKPFEVGELVEYNSKLFTVKNIVGDMIELSEATTIASVYALVDDVRRSSIEIGDKVYYDSRPYYNTTYAVNVVEDIHETEGNIFYKLRGNWMPASAVYRKGDGWC